MRLVRYGRPGAERPGLIDPDGSLRDLSRVVEDLTPAALTPASLRRLRGLKLARLPVVRGRPRLGASQGAAALHQGVERDLRTRRSHRAPARRGEARL